MGRRRLIRKKPFRENIFFLIGKDRFNPRKENILLEADMSRQGIGKKLKLVFSGGFSEKLHGFMFFPDFQKIRVARSSVDFERFHDFLFLSAKMLPQVQLKKMNHFFV